MVLDKHHARRGLAKTEEIDEEVMPVHEDGYPDPEGVFGSLGGNVNGLWS